MGNVFGHSIVFDEAGLLYHHGLESGVRSRLSRFNLSDPSTEEVLADFATDVELTAMTIDGDQFIAARRFPSRSSDLWSIDRTTYAVTVLGTVFDGTAGTISLTGLVFVCAGLGDQNCDGAIDLADFAGFDACVADPTSSARCGSLDFDADRDVDLLDWGGYQSQFSGLAP